MDARTAELMMKITSVKTNLVRLDRDDFEKLKREYCKRLVPAGTLVYCDGDLYIMIDNTWVHLKYCGCDGSCANSPTQNVSYIYNDTCGISKK